MITHAICNECRGACCDEVRLEFPVPRGVTMMTAPGVLEGMGLPPDQAEPIEVRVNEHGRTVVRTRCKRRGQCDPASRPMACLVFPRNYLDANHTDEERAEVREFCPLFTMLEEGYDA